MKTLLHWDIKSCSIIDKILNGISVWNGKELQYQQNFPEDIENVLSVINGAAANSFYYDEILLVPSYYSLSLRALLTKQFTKKGLPVKSVLTATNAVAFAMFSDKQCDKTIVIVILAENYIDLSLLTIEDGVFEVKFTTGLATIGADYKDKLFEVCASYLDKKGNIENLHNIDECIIISEEKPVNDYISIIGLTFEIEPTLDTSLSILYKRGMLIQKGILVGTTKDVLLLDVLPYPIYVDTDSDSATQVVDVNCTLFPTLKSCTIDIPSSGIIAISEGDFSNRITIERYLFDNTSNTEKGCLQIDINAKGIIQTSITALNDEKIS